MKFLLFSLVAAALGGCAYYGDPSYGAYGYPANYGAVAYPSVTVGVYGEGRHRDFPHSWRDSEGRWSDHR